MVSRCPFCGEVAQSSEDVCWFCGQQFRCLSCHATVQPDSLGKCIECGLELVKVVPSHRLQGIPRKKPSKTRKSSHSQKTAVHIPRRNFRLLLDKLEKEYKAGKVPDDIYEKLKFEYEAKLGEENGEQYRIFFNNLEKEFKAGRVPDDIYEKLKTEYGSKLNPNKNLQKES